MNTPDHGWGGGERLPAVSGTRARELLIRLVASSVPDEGASEFEDGVHRGLLIALAAITDDIPDQADQVDPNILAHRGAEVFKRWADNYLLGWLNEKYAMDPARER